MHEASLAGGVLQLIEETAQREGFSRLLELHLEAGQLAGVDVRALRFALESLAPGTLLDGAQIHVDEPPGQAWCMGCAQTVAIAQRGDHVHEVVDHQVLAVGAVGCPVGVAVAARVERDRVVAGRAQALAGAFPRVPRLPATVQQQHERAGGVAPGVGRDAYAARAGPEEHGVGGAG